MFCRYDIPETAHLSCSNSDPKILVRLSLTLLKISSEIHFFFQIITQSLDPLEASDS